MEEGQILREPMLVMADVLALMAREPEDGTFLYPFGEERYRVMKTWYNANILHIDIYQEDGTGDPIEKWLVLQRKNLIDARIVTNDASENFVIGVYENIIKVMDKKDIHVYVEMFEGCIDTIRVFDSDAKYKEAYQKWKVKMEIMDEPEEAAYLDDGTSVQGFETKLE